MMKAMVLFLAALFVVVGICIVSNAHATQYDLITDGASATINGAIYEQLNAERAGTGNFDPFLSFKDTGVEEAYNTSGTPAPFDVFGQEAGRTHNLQLNDLADNILTNYNNSGINYYEFLLDINQNKGGSNEYLSLDMLQIYLSPTPSLTTTTLSGLGTKIYDLSNNWIKLNAELASGSGVGDMRLLLPTSLTNSYGGSTYVYLYNKCGVNNGGNDGFEEWGERTDAAVPEPASMSLLGVGLFGLLGFKRKKSIV